MAIENFEKLVVVDVETSGVNPYRHQILSVSLVPFRRPDDPLVLYIDPGEISWTPFAKKNFERYATEWRAKAVAPAIACSAIEQYLSNVFGQGEVAIPAGHNLAFDVAFLRQLAFLDGRDQVAGLSHRGVDTHTLLFVLYCSGRLPKEALNSDGAFSHFRIRVEERYRHTALGDACATRDLLIRLLAEFGA